MTRVILRPPRALRAAGSKAGKGVVRLPSHARQLVDPRTSARQIRQNPASTIVLLLILLVATKSIANGSPILPTASQGFAWIGAALALIVVAQVAPDLITYSLALVLLYTLLVNESALEDFAKQFTGKLGGGFQGGAPMNGKSVKLGGASA